MLIGKNNVYLDYKQNKRLEKTPCVEKTHRRTTQTRSIHISLINKTMIKFIVYKTTNLITGQYYYGKHRQVSDTFDGYFGSSRTLIKDIEKFGMDNFTRETLYEFDSEQECYLKEQEVISNKWKEDPLCYNKQPGGKGFSSGKNHYSSVFGFSDEHLENLSKSRKKRGPASPETRAKMSKSRTGSRRTIETKTKMSEAQSGTNNPMYGRRHSNEIKRIISDRLAGKYTGEACSSFKGYYVTPFGKFASVKELKFNNLPVSARTIYAWCKKSDKHITKSMVGHSEYLSNEMIGKTFRDIGFYFEERHK